ncbi:hypothetical protein L5515_006303 [Caenorhabditis briggsae]|uniref:Uncharacterized protein n=1 Tax=Caenorhabditis briggsae TaxID=6238 RepID=A0AAE9EZ44_CAEBR|nr:hypothetical protein L5515_006303 [Caenorhabditis briggsae]
MYPLSPEVLRLLAEPTNYTYDDFSLIGSSCQHIHKARTTEAEYLLYLHLIAFVSTLFTFLAVYCILFKSSQSMGNFKWCLLNLQIWTFITDFMIGSAAAPRAFFPIIGGRPLGFLVYLGMKIPVMIYIGFGCFGAMVASVTLLFLYRHQVTVNPNSYFHCHRFFRVAVVVVNYALYVNVTVPGLLTAPEDQLEAKIETLRIEPCPAKDLLHENSYILQSSWSLLLPYFCFMIVFAGVECGFMAVHCSWILFFSTLTRKLSRKTRRMQVKFLFALLAQIAIPTTLCYAPIFYFAITTIIDHYWQFANDVCVLIVSTHGLISATCLLLFYDCYRDHIFYWICLKKFNKSSGFSTENPSRQRIMMTNVQVIVTT